MNPKEVERVPASRKSGNGARSTSALLKTFAIGCMWERAEPTSSRSGKYAASWDVSS
jgi:hypothetical protein